MKSKLKHPSPAMVIAIIALILAVAVPAMAALNSKDKKKVKKIADTEITAKAPGLSVANAANATNASNATNATNATNASTVGGFATTAFHRQATSNEASFIDLLGASGFHGVRIQSRCGDNGGILSDDANLRIVGTSTFTSGHASFASVGGSTNAHHDVDQDFNTGDNLSIQQTANEDSNGTATITSNDGSKSATVTYYATPVILGLGCEWGGTVTSNG
jgi:hypothetical protein